MTRYERRCRQRRRSQARRAFAARQHFTPVMPGLPPPRAVNAVAAESAGATEASIGLLAMLPLLLRGGRRKG